MRGVATKGRYFPIAEGSLASVTKTWRLIEKVRVAMQNPKRALAELRAIAKLRPGITSEVEIELAVLPI